MEFKPGDRVRIKDISNVTPEYRGFEVTVEYIRDDRLYFRFDKGVFKDIIYRGDEKCFEYVSSGSNYKLTGNIHFNIW